MPFKLYNLPTHRHIESENGRAHIHERGRSDERETAPCHADSARNDAKLSGSTVMGANQPGNVGASATLEAFCTRAKSQMTVMSPTRRSASSIRGGLALTMT